MVYGKKINIKSWHREHNLSLHHDPINLDTEGKFRLFPSIGYRLVYEDYDDSNYNSLYYDVTLLGELTDRLVAYTGYHYSRVSAEKYFIPVWIGRLFQKKYPQV